MKHIFQKSVILIAVALVSIVLFYLGFTNVCLEKDEVETPEVCIKWRFFKLPFNTHAIEVEGSENNKEGIKEVDRGVLRGGTVVAIAYQCERVSA